MRKKTGDRKDAQTGEVGCTRHASPCDHQGIEKRRIEGCGIPVAKADHQVRGFRFSRFQDSSSKKA